MKDSSVLFPSAQAEQQTRRSRRKSGRIGDWVAEHPALAAFPFVLGAALLLWEGLVRWQDYPTFILPRPGRVVHKTLTMAADGSLLRTFLLDGRSAAAPMTYLHEGKQYVVVATGGGETDYPSRQQPGDDPDGGARQDTGHGNKQRHAPEAAGREPGDLSVGQAVEQDEFEENDVEEAGGDDGRMARGPAAQMGERPPQQPQAAEGGARPDPVEQGKEEQRGDSGDGTVHPVMHQVRKRDRTAEQQRAEQQTRPQVAAAGDRQSPNEGSGASTFGHGPG